MKWPHRGTSDASQCRMRVFLVF
uniref:Uncharacterized protein n=1 Tax=Arundo donax TaxID=35708 RepID=A0A0A9CDY6_ARUDO